ncbi:CDP-glucose 4,6-dehydratase [Butyrivibrio sp. FCS014]|uniref:CDP-glucose 4,6-dehydratase n=1 Tax=Butyrivibrio sp. FCS014 TaxID=1408304 RepID=UPI0004645FE3|nr:CDP-glucose 4,6-dehydratase [Butyrivibrio sp. FCS014]
MLEFYKGKRIFITGHTGFKGGWLCKALSMAGAEVYGYALDPPTDPSMFALLKLEKEIHHKYGDIRKRDELISYMQSVKPELVIHMAAQPLVRASYDDPVLTYETNVMGTVNICEAVRQTESVRSFLNVTTDKVYKNVERQEGYREDEQLDGYDPYSNSKSCSELVTHSYVNSFLKDKVATSTARAGNVIGGGDFAADRIIPDCVRATMKGEGVALRNPDSVRPYQHVLEPLSAYLLILQKQYENPEFAGSYNVGPDYSDCLTTGQLADAFCSEWNKAVRGPMAFEAFWFAQKQEYAPHEAGLLRLDSTKIHETLGWKTKWDSKTAVSKAVEWYVNYATNKDLTEITKGQIQEYFNI